MDVNGHIPDAKVIRKIDGENLTHFWCLRSFAAKMLDIHLNKCLHWIIESLVRILITAQVTAGGVGSFEPKQGGIADLDDLSSGDEYPSGYHFSGIHLQLRQLASHLIISTF